MHRRTRIKFLVFALIQHTFRSCFFCWHDFTTTLRKTKLPLNFKLTLMKKIMLIAAGALLFSITATYAQTDTTSTRRSTSPTVSPSPTQSPTPTQSPQPGATPGQNYQKDMTRIQATDIPSGMRQTLQDPQYKGWENSTIYKSNTNDGYLLQMNTGAQGQQTQSYRFDAEGKLVPNPK
jgi:hypothetical protein